MVCVSERARIIQNSSSSITPQLLYATRQYLLLSQPGPKFRMRHEHYRENSTVQNAQILRCSSSYCTVLYISMSRWKCPLIRKTQKKKKYSQWTNSHICRQNEKSLPSACKIKSSYLDLADIFLLVLTLIGEAFYRFPFSVTP